MKYGQMNFLPIEFPWNILNYTNSILIFPHEVSIFHLQQFTFIFSVECLADGNFHNLPHGPYGFVGFRIWDVWLMGMGIPSAKNLPSGKQT